MMTNLVSIIIPCYNHGHYIQDALDSIDLSLIDYPVEIIIVNDGSTDEYTIKVLAALSQDNNYLVINQSNNGLATARNVAITAAKGNYIIALDADNKITTSYINKAVSILSAGKYDIVYGKPVFFGEQQKSRVYKAQPFSIYALLEGNFIDACAVFSKTVWFKNKGYDSAMPVNGYEDWEFWINAASNGFEFYFLNESAFYYRIVNNSMMSKSSEEKLLQVHKYLFNKHSGIFFHHFVKLCYIKRKYELDMRAWMIAPFKYILYKLTLKKEPQQKADDIFRKYIL